MRKIHFDTGSGSACKAQGVTSTDLNYITCKNCKRTEAFVYSKKPISKYYEVDPFTRDFFADKVGSIIEIQSILVVFRWSRDGLVMLLQNVTYGTTVVANHIWVKVPQIIQQFNLLPTGSRIRLVGVVYRYGKNKYSINFKYAVPVEQQATKHILSEV